MTGPDGGVLASDADRDGAAGLLADAVAVGRLSLAEHDARLDALFAARTQDQVAALTADLPALPARRGALYRAVATLRGVASAPPAIAFLRCLEEAARDLPGVTTGGSG